ncbi:MAG: Mini-ribonuclease 3 [Acetivibrionales bacterium]|jgi:ribonuclease-3 family protein
MKKDFDENMLELFNSLEHTDIRQYSPLVLAFLGDAVYEVYIRTLLVYQGNAPVHKLHMRSTDFVKAKAQSDIIHRIIDNLSDEEREIVRRGRNAKSGTIPKNADVTEYKYATGFESLIGYLYLKKDFARLAQILKEAVDIHGLRNRTETEEENHNDTGQS